MGDGRTLHVAERGAERAHDQLVVGGAVVEPIARGERAHGEGQPLVDPVGRDELDVGRVVFVQRADGRAVDLREVEVVFDCALNAAEGVEVFNLCTGTKLVDFDRGDWDFTMNLDLSSVFTMTKKFAGYMQKNIEAGKQKYGRIINIASIYGLVGNTAIPTIAYHASKGAVVNFSRGAAAELAPLGITVNTICPGYFYTELTTETLDTEYFQNFAKSTVPMQRYGQSGELNAAAVFLGSEEASYVTGQAIAVDGGYTCV